MDIHKALVVDDSKVAHLTLRKLLSERGIQVDWVGSGEDAITYMEKQRPDIIFLDVMMPGMDGFETAHAITKNPAIAAPPVIMCSANATEEDKENANRNGAVGFLSKPYTPAQMDQMLVMVSELRVPVVEQAVTSDTPAVPARPSVEPEIPSPDALQAIPQSMTAAAPGVATIDVAKVASDTARTVAEKVAREVTRPLAEQIARQFAEEAGRKAAQAAIEAAKKAANDIARTSAAESARSTSEQVARDVSQQVAQQAIARGLSEGRENLIKGMEGHVVRVVREALGQTLTSKEFKQQLQQLAAEGVLPKAEATARQMASAEVDKAAAAVAGIAQKAKLALIIGLSALVLALLGLAKGFL